MFNIHNFKILNCKQKKVFKNLLRCLQVSNDHSTWVVQVQARSHYTSMWKGPHHIYTIRYTYFHLNCRWSWLNSRANSLLLADSFRAGGYPAFLLIRFTMLLSFSVIRLLHLVFLDINYNFTSFLDKQIHISSCLIPSGLALSLVKTKLIFCSSLC